MLTSISSSSAASRLALPLPATKSTSALLPALRTALVTNTSLVLRCTPGSMRTRTRVFGIRCNIADASLLRLPRHASRQLVETLPGGGELTNLRALAGDAEAVIFEELTRQRQTSAGTRWATTQRESPLRCRVNSRSSARTCRPCGRGTSNSAGVAVLLAI